MRDLAEKVTYTVKTPYHFLTKIKR
jgi:hypothetical protein